jgi:hypothetical protein
VSAGASTVPSAETTILATQAFLSRQARRPHNRHKRRTHLTADRVSLDAVALASSSVVHAARDLSTLTVKLSRVTAQDPRPGCLDATEARGTASGWRVPGDRGRSRVGGRTPARIIQRALTPAGGRARGMYRRSQLVRYMQPGAGGCGCSARPALSAVTLSDMEGQGERAHCRRYDRQSTVSSTASHACRTNDLCVTTGVVWAVRPAAVSISLLPGLDAGSGMIVVHPDGTGIGGPSSR